MLKRRKTMITNFYNTKVRPGLNIDVGDDVKIISLEKDKEYRKNLIGKIGKAYPPNSIDGYNAILSLRLTDYVYKFGTVNLFKGDEIENLTNGEKITL